MHLAFNFLVVVLISRYLAGHELKLDFVGSDELSVRNKGKGRCYTIFAHLPSRGGGYLLEGCHLFHVWKPLVLRGFLAKI